MTKRAIWVLVGLGVLALAALGYSMTRRHLAQTAVKKMIAANHAPSPTIGGPFKLVDHNGKTVTDADYRGRYMLVVFGYTYCPDVCPTILQTITEALGLLGKAAAKVQPIFISVDPQRDTPRVLKSYVANFHRRLIGLTGSPDQISAVARAYRVYYAKVKEKKAAEGDYLMNHSAVIYLMGPDGKFVTHFSHNATPEQIAAKMRKYL